MAKTSPVEFIQQVGAETSKVVWPTRRETTITTIMVVVFTFVAAVFFSIVDFIIRFGLTNVMDLIVGVGR